MHVGRVNRTRRQEPLWIGAGTLAWGLVIAGATYQFGLPGLAAAVGAPAMLGWLYLAGGFAWTEARALAGHVRGLMLLLAVLLAGLWVESMLPDISERTAQQLAASPFNVSNLLRTATVALAGLLCGALALHRPVRVARASRGPLAGLVIFAVTAVASVAWASAPLVSAGKALEVAVDVLFGLLCAAMLSPEALLTAWNLIWASIGALVVAVWVGTALNPSDAFDVSSGNVYILHGSRPSVATNTLGQFAAGLVVIACCRLVRRGKPSIERTTFWLGVAGLGAVTAVAAQARTTLVALPIALAACFFLYERWRLLVVSLAAGMLSLATPVGTVLLDFLRRNQDADQLTSLSGRLGYWSAAWDFFRESMLFGHGYYTSTRLDLNARYIYTGLDLSSVDNTYLEALLGVGLVGTVPLVLGLLGLAWLAIRALRSRAISADLGDGVREMLSVLVLIFFRSLTGSTFQRHSENLLLVVVAMALVQQLARRRVVVVPAPGSAA